MKLAMAAILLLAPQTLIAECSGGASDSLFAVSSWSASVSNGDYGETLEIEFALENQGEKGVRMVDASMHFDDVLGRRAIGFLVMEDVTSLGAGETYLHTSRFGGVDMNLGRSNPEDFNAFVCVKGVVYEDGVVERFE